jgi:serine/threonine-protein kinase
VERQRSFKRESRRRPIGATLSARDRICRELQLEYSQRLALLCALETASAGLSVIIRSDLEKSAARQAVNSRNFFSELKRRNVYKVAIAYAVVAWLLMQIATQVFPFLEIPNWAIRLVIMLIVIGFPIALVIAWAFELTPEGLKRTEFADELPKKSARSRAWIYVVIIAGAISVSLFFLGRYTAASKQSEPSNAGTQSASAIPEKSIAVLPFENASGNAETEYLSDGISETLINSLTELQQLKVIARSTAFRYKGKEIDPQAVGRELKVRAVLMGLVRQVGDRLNVQVDLVDATTGAQLWGEEYERKLSDVLSVKQTIAREVTEKLRLRLTGEQQQRLVKRDTTNAEAYQFYLKGRYYWEKRTAENLTKAIDQFQQAADKDPNYALAYVGLADCYVLLEDYVGTPASEIYPKAKAFAERALQLDSSLSEAHTSLAYVYSNLWQWEQAEEEFKRAIKLDPNYPTAHHWYSLYLRNVDRFDDGMTEIKRAHELDPLSLVIGGTLTYAYIVEGDVNSAIAQSKRVIDLDPNFPRAHEYLGLAYLKQGRHSEAIAELQKAVELSGRERWPLGDLGYGYAISGKRVEALAVLKELEGKYQKHETIGQDLAAVYAGLGEKDQVFAWLEKDFQARSGLLTRIRWTPPFESLRSDPRYADLVRRMGLQP